MSNFKLNFLNLFKRVDSLRNSGAMLLSIYKRRINKLQLNFSLSALLPIFFIIFTIVILALTIRGLAGNPDPDMLNSPVWKENGPFELSPERGRFTLLYSIVENKSFYFSVSLARFAVPDLGYKNGHYVSLFAPAVSFFAMPGYIIGKYFNISQVGTYSVVALFALLNIILIYLICIRLGANRIASLLAAGTFLFATPAFSYSASLYEHHFSTFLILFSLYVLLRWDNFWSVTIIWFCCALSIPVDNPNVFFMAPIGIYALGRLFIFKKQENKLKLNIRLFRLVTFLGLVIPLVIFGYVNYKSYGSPFQLAGTVGSVSEINTNGNPTAPKTATPANIDKLTHPDTQQKSVIRFFKSRNLLNGMYILFFSPDRGTIEFAPIVILSLFGIMGMYKKNTNITILLCEICVIVILLYSMWGDPWGGWAFGPRYLIPAFAVLSIFIGFALTKFKKNSLFLIFFLLLFSYSTYVNTIGVLTSNANPPQLEVLNLEKITGRQEKYTYERDLDLLKNNSSKSYVWQTFAKKTYGALQYFYTILFSILLVHVFLLTLLLLDKKELQNEI